MAIWPLDKRPNLASLNFTGAEPVEEQVIAIPPNANDAQVSEPADESDEW